MDKNRRHGDLYIYWSLHVYSCDVCEEIKTGADLGFIKDGGPVT